MSESDSEKAEVKVNDRRRFDADGNVRPEAWGPVDEGTGQPVPGPQVDPAGEAQTLQLKAELEAARKRVDELARAFQSVNADREDFKLRLTRERERLVDVEKAHVAQVLLDVMDELDMSLHHAGKDDSPLAQGVRLIRDGILAKLQGVGIERVPVLDLPYDPNVAEATDMTLTTDPDEDQKVTGEIRAGYRFKDKIIRPARVRVAKYVKPAWA